MSNEKKQACINTSSCATPLNPQRPTENKMYILLRIVEGVSIALWRFNDSSTPEILTACHSHYTHGHFRWGDKSDACHNLALTIISVAYEFDNMSEHHLKERANRLVDDVLADLSSQQPHDLSVGMLRRTLGDHEIPLIHRSHF